MRLIDADALIQKRNHAKAYAPDMYVIGQGYVMDAPTISAVPVVRGEWVLVGTNEHDYETSVEEKCSLCGRYVYRYDTEPQDNYCPNCGAKMDDEHRESEDE